MKKSSLVSPKVRIRKPLVTCPADVAQWTSHPPQEQEDPGSNPARVKGFKGIIAAPFALFVLKRRNKGIVHKNILKNFSNLRHGYCRKAVRPNLFAALPNVLFPLIEKKAP
jgi:hypothetical protein